MNLSRRLKRAVSQMLIGLMLFTQLAVAAYACPLAFASDLQSLPVAASTVAAAEPMTDCDQMGAMAGAMTSVDTPNLCAEHCHWGQQSHQVQVPTLADMTPVTLYTLELPLESAIPMPAMAASFNAPAAASPPHAILHCCFRV